MMWVYNDHIELWNEGELPENMDVSTLLKKHKSRQRNPKIANVFYRAGLIEIWGRGINKIRTEFEKGGMTMPDFEETEGGLMVSFKRKHPAHQEKGSENATTQVATQATTQVQALISAIGNEEMSVKQLMEALNLKNRHNFLDNYLTPAIEGGLLTPIFPNQPRHPRQKYRRK